MRRSAANVSVVLVVLLAISGSSCRKKSQTLSQPYLAVIEESPIENSGRTISGRFVVRQLKDHYVKRALSPGTVINYDFESDGSFNREELAGSRRVLTESGSYLIGTKGEMMLYIERVGTEPLRSARTERYVLAESGDRMELRAASDAVIQLERALP